MAAWLILHHCVLLDAVCDPGSGGSRSSCKIPVAVQSLRCLAVSPLSGECLHRAAHQSNLVSCRYCPCCLHPLVERRPLQLNFRGYLPDSSSIDSPRNLSSSRSTCCQTWIRAVDYPYPEGFAPSRWRTLSSFPPNFASLSWSRNLGWSSKQAFLICSFVHSRVG